MTLFDDELETDFFDAPDEAPAPVVEEDCPKTPRTQPTLVGHDQVEKRLLDLIASDRLPQSMIFTGSAGIGKSTAAFRLARYLFKYKNKAEEEGGLFGGFDPAPAPADTLFVSPSDPVFQLVASGGYPDLLTIEREEDEKGKLKGHDLKEVRDVTNFFRRTSSYEGGWRIAIVDDTDTMNWYAQNALLKILEEPPQKSLLILITHRLGALLPTILSRSQVIHFHPLSEQNLRAVLKHDLSRHPEDVQNRILRMASGSVSRALSYADPACGEIMDQAMDILSSWPRFDWTRIQLFADTVGAKGSGDAGQMVFQDAMLSAVSHLAKTKSLGQENPDLPGLSNGYSLAKILEAYDALKLHFDKVQTGSLDKRFMVMGAYAVFES
jgi:DNA polymerase-3 subunit delta'